MVDQYTPLHSVTVHHQLSMIWSYIYIYIYYIIDLTERQEKRSSSDLTIHMHITMLLLPLDISVVVFHLLITTNIYSFWWDFLYHNGLNIKKN